MAPPSRRSNRKNSQLPYPAHSPARPSPSTTYAFPARTASPVAAPLHLHPPSPNRNNYAGNHLNLPTSGGASRLRSPTTRYSDVPNLPTAQDQYNIPRGTRHTYHAPSPSFGATRGSPRGRSPLLEHQASPRLDKLKLLSPDARPSRTSHLQNTTIDSSRYDNSPVPNWRPSHGSQWSDRGTVERAHSPNVSTADAQEQWPSKKKWRASRQAEKHKPRAAAEETTDDWWENTDNWEDYGTEEGYWTEDGEWKYYEEKPSFCAKICCCCCLCCASARTCALACLVICICCMGCCGTFIQQWPVNWTCCGGSGETPRTDAQILEEEREYSFDR